MDTTEIKEIDEVNDQRAVSEEIQSKCSLAAVCMILLDLPTTNGGMPNKDIKKILKLINKDINKSIGKAIAKEIINGNLAALKGAADGIINSDVIPDGKHHLLLDELRDGLVSSLGIGYEKFYGEELGS